MDRSRRVSEADKGNQQREELHLLAMPRSASSMAHREVPARRPFVASPDFAANDARNLKADPPIGRRSISNGYGPSLQMIHPSTSKSRLVLSAIARPFYLLARRGPALPIFITASIIIVFFLNIYSSSSTATFGPAQSTQPLRYDMNDQLPASMGRTSPFYKNGLNRAGKGKAKGRLDRLKEMPGARWAFEAGSRWAGFKETFASPQVNQNFDFDDSEVGEEDRLWMPKAQSRHNADLQELLGDSPAEDSGRSARPPQAGKSRRRDGRLLVVEGQEHPIPRLMERAKRRWKKLNDKQSKTFAQAVKEYKKRYGRRPPKGFDQWYAFARDNNVKLIDEFDLIERDLHAYRALSPASFRARVNKCRDVYDHSWGMRIDAERGNISLEGELAEHQRAQDVKTLCKRFKHALNTDMLMWYNGHDNSRVMVSWEEKNRLEELVSEGEYDDDNLNGQFEPKLLGPFPHWGVAQVCPPNSALRAPGFEFGDASRDWTGLEMPQLPVPEKPGQKVVGTFIDSFKRYLDVCENPQYRHFHSSTSWVYTHFATGLLPLLTPGVHSNYNDIHSLIVEQFDIEDTNNPAWHERPFDRVVWRGQTSGPQWDRYCAWISSHRSRLHLLSHNELGERNITLSLPDDRIQQKGSTPSAKEVARSVTVSNYRVNPSFLDTGMVGPPVQCIAETCDEMRKVYKDFDPRLSLDRSNLYKYALDVDGNSWSGRFRRLMLSHAAVLKATIYTEFWTDWSIPWLHFIPVQIDYSDIWDIMAFFRGGLSGEGAHDHLAQEIAENGRSWAQNYFRWQDLEAYQFRLMLEYGRLYSDDRANMDYVGEGDDLAEPEWVPAEGFTKRPREGSV